MSNVEHLLHCQNQLGEGPLWSVDEQAFYWIDISAHTFSRLDPVTGVYSTVNVGTSIGVLAERASGGLVMATRRGFAYWNAQQNVLEVIHHPEAEKPYMRFNDGAVDSNGRFWAGTMRAGSEGDPQDGVLYRLDPDGTVHAMLKNVTIPNGIGWSPDNKTMYFTDSAARTIYAFDYDHPTGTISNQRIFVQTFDKPGVPDGLTIDSEGYIWSAFWDGARIIRFDPEGKIEREIPMPVLRPSSCVFGGPDLTDLYITSASVDTDAQRQQYPLSGDLFVLKADIRGMPKFKFGA